MRKHALSRDNNKNIVNKPISYYLMVYLFILIIMLLWIIFTNSDSLSVNQSTIIGAICSTVISFTFLIITLNTESRKNYLDAQKSAKILYEILNSVDNQIQLVKNNNLIPITFSSNWIYYYEKCAIYLEYDYLQYLLKEFETVEKINNCINDKYLVFATDLISERINRIKTNFFDDYDIFSVKLNLLLFSEGSKEDISWKYRSDYLNFEKFFIKEFSDKVKSWTILYISDGNNYGCNEVSNYIMKALKYDQDFIFKTKKYTFLDMAEDKYILKAIFEIYSSLKPTDAISLCWGKLTLNNCEGK